MNQRWILAPLALAALTACSPERTAWWLDWHNQDPEAAEAILDDPGVQSLIHDDTDRDGVVEPDNQPASQSGNSGGGSSGWGKWDPILRCESNFDWDYNGPSGFDGAPPVRSEHLEGRWWSRVRRVRMAGHAVRADHRR